MTRLEDSPVESITKFEAATRLLRTAIWMFFEEKDGVAVHVLAAAAHEVLQTLLKREGKGISLLKDNPLVPPPARTILRKAINRPYNFFKHADRDPDGRVLFRAELTVAWLFDSITMYYRLTGELFREAEFFLPYFVLKYEQYLEDHPLAERARALKVETGGEADKRAFLMLMKNPRLASDRALT